MDRAITLVLMQTLKDRELICVDNGSSDATGRKLGQATAAHKRVSILSEATPGAGPARNTGRLAARGTFVAFLDADDQFAAPETLAKLVRSATQSGVTISGGSMRLELAQ